MRESMDPMMKKIQALDPQKLYISCWKGVDDILDNVSGVTVSNAKGHTVAQVTLVQLDCHNDYTLLAQAITEKMESDLKTEGFEISVRSSF
jgi:hypothetical protein